MKIHFYIFCILWMALFSERTYSQEICDSVLTEINDLGVRNILDNNRMVFLDFSNVNYQVIPQLISKIDSNSMCSAFNCVGIYDSSIPNVYIGECAAKYIELIIDPTFKYKRITKNGDYFSLTKEDMSAIKELYKEWWTKNERTEQRMKGNSALDGSIYKWAPCQ